MPNVQLYINNLPADTSGGVRIVLDKVTSDYRNPLKKTGEYSYTIKLPKSAANRRLFHHEDDLAVLGKFRRSYSAFLESEGTRLITGTFTHTSNEPDYFVGHIVGTFTTKVGAILDPDKSLRDIQSFQKLDYRAGETLAESLNNASLFWSPENTDSSADWREVVYPYVVDSFARLKDLQSASPGYGFSTYVERTYENHGISHFVGAVVSRIFEDAGYTIAGDVLSDPAFRKLVMLYSNEDGQTEPYNYGRLALMTSSCPSLPLGGAFTGASIGRQTDRQSDYVMALTYPFAIEGGDLALCLGSDGVYTPKFTGTYGIRIRAESVVNHVSGTSSIPTEGFTCLRCISDDDFIPEQLLPSSGFDSVLAEYLDAGTLVVADSSTGPYPVRLEAGKQYQVQRYIRIPKSSGYGSAYFIYNPSGGVFSILSCNGPMLLDPAKFLPDMKQVDFLLGVLKLFNLYPVVDGLAKTVTFYKRDDFFALNADSIIDLTERCNPDKFTERPFSVSEAAEMSLSYASDEDYLCKRTDLLAQANKSAPENSYTLPFAPLGFVETKIRDAEADNVTFVDGVDLTPCILPDADPANNSLLEHYAAEYRHAYKPRVALYEAGAIKDGISSGTGTFGGGIFGGFSFPLAANLGYTARLSAYGTTGFKYKLVENPTLRLIHLEPSTDPDIYAEGSTTFLRDPEALTDVSLAVDVTDPIALYSQFYSSERRTLAFSHYAEGRVRIDGALYNRLNGQGVIRIGTGYYLLSGISGYEVGENSATIQLYVHVN